MRPLSGPRFADQCLAHAVSHFRLHGVYLFAYVSGVALACRRPTFEAVVLVLACLPLWQVLLRGMRLDFRVWLRVALLMLLNPLTMALLPLTWRGLLVPQLVAEGLELGQAWRRSRSILSGQGRVLLTVFTAWMGAVVLLAVSGEMALRVATPWLQGLVEDPLRWKETLTSLGWTAGLLISSILVPGWSHSLHLLQIQVDAGDQFLQELREAYPQ